VSASNVTDTVGSLDDQLPQKSHQGAQFKQLPHSHFFPEIIVHLDCCK
jgi:hypothetical protein